MAKTPIEEAPLAQGHVNVRITKFGAGKVSTGEHVAVTGDVMASQGQVLVVTDEVAMALESRGLAEIQ